MNIIFNGMRAVAGRPCDSTIADVWRTPFRPDKYTDFPLTFILHSPFSILNYSTFPLSTPQNMVH